MGDMADYVLEQMESFDGKTGSDYFGNVMFDEERGVFEGPGYQRAKKCRYCKQTGLHWIATENGWRLADAKNQIHTCPQYKP